MRLMPLITRSISSDVRARARSSCPLFYPKPENFDNGICNGFFMINVIYEYKSAIFIPK